MAFAEAVEEEPTEPVRIDGMGMVTRDGEETLVCARLVGSPRRCSEPRLRVEGLGNAFRAVEGLERRGVRDGTIGWSESVTAEGIVRDGRFVLLPRCDTQRVIAHLEDAFGTAVYRDLFVSNADADYVTFDAAPSRREAAVQRRRWGRFSVAVVHEPADPLRWVLEQHEPYVEQVGPMRRGIRWRKLERVGWTAIKPYGRRTVLVWIAGANRRLDSRFRRVDEVLSELD